MKLTVIALALVMPTAAAAQVQVGTGARGGLCFGPNCGPGAPDNVGTGARGGLCFGPNCGPIDSPNRSFGYTPPPNPGQSSSNPPGKNWLNPDPYR